LSNEFLDGAIMAVYSKQKPNDSQANASSPTTTPANSETQVNAYAPM